MVHVVNMMMNHEGTPLPKPMPKATKQRYWKKLMPVLNIPPTNWDSLLPVVFVEFSAIVLDQSPNMFSPFPNTKKRLMSA